ncbi:MAG: lipopolysaccharide biosynthesis protein, partial [Desulfocucumaceae bacterium]
MKIEELKNRTIKAFLWVMLGAGLQRLIDIATKIVLVRLLLPVEFGIVATAYIIINLLKVFSETGISTAIIRRQESDEESFSTAFFFNLAVSFISLISVFFLAPLAAAYFKNSSLVPVIRVLSLVIFIESFFYVHNTLFMQNLDFKDKAIPDLLSAIIYSVCGITLACLNFGLWSLVWSSLARSAATALLYWKFSPWRPKARFNYAKLKPLLGLGVKISAVKIIRYARNNVDYLVIAKFLGPVALGYYYVAYEVAHYCDAQLSPLLSKIMFSAFGKLKEKETLGRYYFNALKYVAILGVFVSFLIFALSKWIVLFLYGPKWLPSVIPMQF